MLTFLVILLGLLVYLNIGYLWGSICWDVFQANQDKEQESFFYHMFFPQFWLKDDNDYGYAFVNSNPREVYAYAMAFSWPLKIVWNIITAIATIAVYGWLATGASVTSFCKFVPTLAARLVLRTDYK